MNKSDAPRRWFGHWFGAARHTQDDPADLGTAFGLDRSLSELAEEPPAPPAPAPLRTGWAQRMTLRRKPAY